MRKIAVLDQITIDKIAAGEVVERPSSVAKELVENAIDAGATAVTVEIRDGGISFLRITDNGCGIPQDQVRTAFYRHATSKITTADDLHHILSLGFRGEALSSIAAVAQVELITKTADEFTGTRYIIEGGVEKSMDDVGAPDGTTFIIRNLFFNTPVRGKFLKTPATEAGYINNIMEQLALSNPQIGFKFVVNGQVKLHTTGSGNMKDAIYSVYGRDVTKELVDIKYERDGIYIGGYIAKPTVSRGNRNFENYYVNGRLVKNRVVTKAIEDAYHSHMMQHKYPFTALSIQVQKDILDVNVHPTKKEVRFSNEPVIYNAVYEAVSQGLYHRELIPDVTIDVKKEIKKEKVAQSAVAEPFETKRRELENKATTPNTLGTVTTPTKHSTNAVSSANTAKNIVGESAFSHKAASNERDSRSSVLTAKQQADTQQVLNQIHEAIKIAEEAEKRMTQGAADAVSYASSSSYTPKQPSLIQDDRGVYQVCENTAKTSVNTLEKHSLAEISNESAIFSKSAKPETESAEIESNKKESNKTASDITAKSAVTAQKIVVEKSEQLTLFEKELLAPESRVHHKIIGQLFDTYWLVEFDDKLFIIDQHAAHEKVLYEKLMKEYKEKEITSQIISPPIVVSLNMEEETAILDYMDVFHELGFQIEHFGGKEYVISEVPYNLYGLNSKDLFIEILDSLSEEGSRVPLAMVTDKLATVACKAAVKGNNKLSYQETEALIDELMTLDNPYQCPHGRPTIISMSKFEIEKKFRRIV